MKKNIKYFRLLTKTCPTMSMLLKPDYGKNVFHWENISVDSAKINWDKIKKEGKVGLSISMLNWAMSKID